MEKLKQEKILYITPHHKIKYMDGMRLNRAIVAGIRFLISRQDHLNKINVFPVPDGDTGTNMSFTMSSILEVSTNEILPRVDEFTKLISDAAIDGARGNSGVLIAQFFVGFSEACEGKEKLDCSTLAKAFHNGAISAREAMEDPKEGTILTIFDDLSNSITESVDSGLDDIYKISGTASGNAANGNYFNVLINKALEIHLDCYSSCLVKSGTAKISPNGYPDRIINYGNSICDCNFDISINGINYPILIN